MLTAFEICKAAYPGIPDQIFLEYADLLPAEASALSAEFAATDAKFFPLYKNLRLSYPLEFQYVSGGEVPAKLAITQNFLTPQNVNDPQTAQLGVTYTEVHWARSQGATGYEFWGHPYQGTAIATTSFDRRIFANPKLTKTSEQPMPASIYTIHTRAFPASIWVQYYARVVIQTLLTINKQPYSGAAMIYALYENGVALPDVDYARLSAFVAYINAYKKFSTQIEAEKSLLANQAAASLAAYRQDFQDRANRENAELQSKKLQIFIAIDNEAKSAQRDFQNMLINAQNLRNNVGGSLG